MSLDTQLFVNNWSTVCSASVAPADTEITIPEAQSTLLGAIADNEYYRGTLSDGTNLEIIYITDNDQAGTITVQRAKESTSALTYVAGNAIEVRVTAGTLDALRDHAARHVMGSEDEIDGDKLDIDYTPTNYTPDTTPAEATSVDHLAAHLAGIDNILGGWTGVSWNESTDAYTRRGSLAGQATGASPGNALLPIHAAMRRCVMSDAGVVQYYLDPDDSTKKADGSASDLTGGDGQVMVEIPKFYVKYSYATNVHAWDISLQPLAGFVPHPAFFKDGAWVDYRYIGAYEGSMYDASAGAMTPDADITTDMYAAGDKLCSITSQYPKTNETRSEFRAMAAERGTGWRQLDYYLLAAVQVLYLVEYADFDSQSMIGQGRTQLSGGTWVAGSYLGESGLSNGDGNGTNCVDYSGDADDAGADAAYMTYRGIENFWGNIWKWVDGININDNIPYFCNVGTSFADDTTTGYARPVDYDGVDVTLHNANGWQTTLERISTGFLPSAVGGSSSTYICDYYYQDTGWRVVLFGGAAYGGSSAGAFYVYAHYTSSFVNVTFGGRLCF